MIDYNKLEKEALEDGVQKIVVGGIIPNKEKEVLFLQRFKDDFMGGIYELPSGNVEEGETLDYALKREISEESGLKVKNVVDYLDFFDYNSKSGKKVRQFNFLVDVFATSPINLTEHSSWVWLNKENIKKYSVTDKVKETVSKYFKNYVGK